MMPAYNAEKYIGQAIESVLGQSYADWELIIVDDGSTDCTAEIASRYFDPRIRLVHQANGGEASARNTALRIMRGEFLAFLDADDLFLPHHLKSGIEFLSRHDHLSGVYSDGYYMDHAENRLQTLSSRRRGPFEGDLFDEVVYASDVFGPPVCVLLRTDLIHEHSLKYDDNIVIGPDWDFFTQYAALAKFGYVDQKTCLYRLHTDNISITTSLEKRTLELAKCRINAIRMKNFGRCSVNVRTAVFYDLLVNLLIDFPERQIEITQWAEFLDLPQREQARLLRLMASKTIVHGRDQTHVWTWLERARQVNPSDWRAIILWHIFRIHPGLLSAALKIKEYREFDPRTIPPFADMNLSRNR